MPSDICIVHVEDEFPQMKPIPSKLKDYVEQYWNDRDGGDNFTKMREKRQSPIDPAWVVYDIACPKRTKQVIRYIFVAPEEIPDEVASYFCGNVHFIIDVLRPASDARRLWVTGDISIKSAMKYGATTDTITIFTACQGTELLSLLAEYPGVEMIRKSSTSEFNNLLSSIVVRGMNGG